MHMKRLLALLLVSVSALVSAPIAPAQTPFDLTGIDWTIAPHADGESAHLTMKMEPLHARDRMVLRLPLWRPGSYRYASYQNKISGLKAFDQDGNPVALDSLDPRSWQVDAEGLTSLRVEYHLAVDNDAAAKATPVYFLHGPATFLWLEGAEDLPHFLHLDLPEGWDFSSGHRPYPGENNTWYSPNFDVFVDCPMAFGAMEKYFFELQGKEFEVALLGRVPSEARFDREDWIDRVRRISQATYDIVGDFPFERYVYLFIFNRIGGYSGLEHLNSTTIQVSHRMIEQGQLEPLESVTAHEFFHAWNVKRIRPQNLGPFDYTKDARTTDLWWMEGVTSYYNDVILERAGLRADNEDWFLESQLRNRRTLENSQGYGVASPEQASWKIWQDDSNVSYYDQGQGLGLLLDIRIRQHTGNRRSLDDVVRALDRWVAYPDRGLREGDLQRMIHAVSGWDASEFFDLYISGTHKFPYEEVLPLAGLSVTSSPRGSAYLGLRVNPDLGIDRPQAPFRDGDVLLRIDGQEMFDLDGLRTIIPTLAPGQLLSLDLRGADGATRSETWTVKERDRDVFRVATGSSNELWQGILEGYPRNPATSD